MLIDDGMVMQRRISYTQDKTINSISTSKQVHTDKSKHVRSETIKRIQIKESDKNEGNVDSVYVETLPKENVKVASIDSEK